MRRRCIYFLLTYFHNSSKKEHITKYSIKVRLTALKRPICQARRLPRRPVGSNWPAATPTGHFLSGPSCFSETDECSVQKSSVTGT